MMTTTPDLEKDNKGTKITEVQNRKQTGVEVSRKCPWQPLDSSCFAFMNSANNSFVFIKRLQLWSESCAGLIYPDIYVIGFIHHIYK